MTMMATAQRTVWAAAERISAPAAATGRLRRVRPAAARRSAANQQVALEAAALALFAAVAGSLATALPLATQLPSNALFDLSRLWLSAGLPPLG